MKQKIEWYKEVLELEPGSRVFFPLARLLAEDGQAPEAVAILYQGLLRHPDHIEARLLLVEFLQRIGDTPRLWLEVENIGRLFIAYPSFWAAWGDVLDRNPSMHDAALALRFFASALQGKPVTWASIIEHGLASILKDGVAVAAPARDVPTEEAITLLPEFVEESLEVEPRPAVPAAFRQNAPEVVVADEEEEGDEADSEAASGDDTDPDEPFSIRTRSMAEVLAEQGDYPGAADIYRELLAQATEEERPALEKRLDELLAKPLVSVPAQPHDDKSVSIGQSSRLADLLESLAQRLENRAR